MTSFDMTVCLIKFLSPINRGKNDAILSKQFKDEVGIKVGWNGLGLKASPRLPVQLQLVKSNLTITAD